MGNGQWNIPELLHLLEIIPERQFIKDFMVRHRFDTIGEKVLLLNARHIALEDGRAGLILLAIEDITGQSVEQELEEKSVLLDVVLDSIPEGIIITDANHVVKKVRRYFGKLFGLLPEKLLGTDEPMRLDMIELYWPDGTRLNSPNDLPLSKAALT
jgi:PAS domain-containing protein